MYSPPRVLPLYPRNPAITHGLHSLQHQYDFWSLTHEGKLVTLGGSGAFSTFGKLYGDSWAMDLE